MPKKKTAKKPSLKNPIILIIVFIVVSVLLGYSYMSFLNYRPKALKQIREIKDIQATESLNIPYPRDSQRIGFNQTSEMEQTTFQTQKSQTEVQDFYNIVFLERGWELESEGSQDGSLISKYKNEDKLVTISTFDNESGNNTIVGIEITNR